MPDPRRRQFMRLLGGAVVAWPLAARGQQQMPVVGLLSSVTARQWAPFVSAFLQGLNELGFVEGQNVATEQRWAGGQYDRLPAMATDLVQRKVAVVAAWTIPDWSSGDPWAALGPWVAARREAVHWFSIGVRGKDRGRRARERKKEKKIKSLFLFFFFDWVRWTP